MESALQLLALIILTALGYAASLWIKPMTACRRCGGWGHEVHYDDFGRPVPGAPCRPCKSSGQRVRLGRRLYTSARATRRDGTR